MDDSLLPLSASLSEDASTAGLTKSIGKVFDTNFKVKVIVAFPFTDLADSNSEFNQSKDNLTSQMNVVLERINQLIDPPWTI